MHYGCHAAGSAAVPFRNGSVTPMTSPLWVADMDFVSPPEVVSALQSRVAHGVFGYGRVTDALHETLCEWSATHYDWSIEPDWQVWVPGVVPALHLAAQAF